MARLLVCWTRPHHLSTEEAEAWVSAELRRVLAADRLGAVTLTRLRSASDRYGTPADWLLELDVESGRDARARLESPVWMEWLGDLRLLGMRPAAMVAEQGLVLTTEED